jgi:hypothetical protein
LLRHPGIGKARLLGLLILLHFFDLASLILDFLLLLLELTLGLLVLNLLILKFVADHVATASAQSPTNCSASPRMPDRRADYCASTSAEQRTYASPFFALTERLPLASGYKKDRDEGDSDGSKRRFTHSGLLPITGVALDRSS